MTFVRIDFEVHGDKQISRGFELLPAWAEDMHDPLDRMADVILDSVRMQFDSEGVTGLGKKWSPLNPEYAAWKHARYGPRPILVRQGGMKGAALNKSTAVTVGAKRMVYEPRSSYLGYHQSGTSRMPARKVVSLTTAQKREAVDRVFSEWIHELKQAAFAG